MTRTLTSLVIVLLVVSAAWLERLTDVPPAVFSYYVVASNAAIVRVGGSKRFTGLRALSASERNRCWDLLHEIVKVLLYAPDRFASLERVVRAYAEDLPRPPAPEPGTGTVTP